MNKVLGNFVYVCGEIWKNIAVAQKISIILVALIGLGTIGGVIFLGTRPNWQVVYSNLDSETASKVYEIVKDEGIPVKLKSGGRTVMVPYRYVNSIRLKVTSAGVGVDGKGVGFELFDNVKLGLTDMQQKVGYQRAIQGELRRMIIKLPGVKNARVMLAIPQRRVFEDPSKNRPKASIFVECNPGYIIGPSEVASIRHMVSSAVEMINPADVTITDNNGRLLAKASNNPLGGVGSSENMDFKKRQENLLREKVEAILTPIVGKDSVVAMVSLDINFDIIDKVSETFDSAGVIVISQKSKISENSKNAPKISKGAPGLSSNKIVSVSKPSGSAVPLAKESDKTTESQYIVPKSTEKVRITTPRINKISVAVTIAKKKDGTARTAEKLIELEKLVSSAVGAVKDAKAGRSDSVTIFEADFLDKKAESALEASALNGDFMFKLERMASSSLGRPVLGIFLLFFLYYIFGANFKKAEVDTTDLNSSVGAYDMDDEVGMLQDKDEDSPFDFVNEKAENDPALVAGAIQEWLLNESSA